MSVREFAEREGVSTASLYRWLAQARADEGAPAFVEVRRSRHSEKVVSDRVGLELPGGVRVHVTSADPVEFVARLAMALRQEDAK